MNPVDIYILIWILFILYIYFIIYLLFIIYYIIIYLLYLDMQKKKRKLEVCMLGMVMVNEE